MIHASIRMKFASDKLAEASEILCAIVERTRVGPGCLGCDIYQDLLDPGVLLLEEWWNTQAELDRRLRSVLYQPVILVMEMALEFPTIRFSEISTMTGIETIKKSRCGLSF
jgi:quinol monooxygenase YgiN